MVSAGLIGPVAVWAAIICAFLAVVTGKRWALVVSSLGAAVATLILTVALVSGDFSLAYVAETTSLATPWPYRIAALWGGMDGSMLFYTTLVLLISAAAIVDLIPVRVAATVGLGLLVITLIFANPFVVVDLPPVDGSGLLAILQHPAMIYHPPLLYLGLTVLVVPFAITAGMVLGGSPRRVWMALIRRWLYVSWVLLTVGMAAGANWAYVELGWGGYWAWDPVENTALMPWLATTVFLHTSRLEEATGRMRRWNVVFASLPFALTVVGIYLTRSGSTGSIHSFAEDPVVGRVLLVSAALVAVFVIVLTSRSDPGERWDRFRLDRSGWLAIHALLLTTVLVFVSAGSIYPAFSSAFLGDQVAVDARFFVVTVLPLAVVVAASLALALRRRSWVVFAVTSFVVAGGVAALIGPRVGLFLLAPAAGSLLALGVDSLRQRPHRRLWPAHLAHIGMALFLVAVAGSAFGADHTGSMRPGDSVVVAGHEVTLVTVDTGEADRYVFARAEFTVDDATLVPEIRAYEDQAVPVAEPALWSTPRQDVIVAVSLLFPDGETMEVSVFVRPLVWWVWVGAALIALGGLLALAGRGGADVVRRRSARAEQPRGGTTSGSTSR
jgi:cytochrome c-type biogenesis protein CcmF